METGPKEAARVRDLAERLYVDLVGRATLITETSVKMAASADNIAKLSLRLAQAFYDAEEKADAAKKPKTTYSLDASDIESWTK